MLFTAILGVLLNILIAWILAGGGLKLFKEILIGVFFGVSSNDEEDESIKKSQNRKFEEETDYDIEMVHSENKIKNRTN